MQRIRCETVSSVEWTSSNRLDATEVTDAKENVTLRWINKYVSFTSVSVK